MPLQQSIDRLSTPAPAARSECGSVQLSETLNLPGFVMAFDRNEEIFGEEESADFVYKVISGMVRVLRFTGDGRRQISAFVPPGEIFGLEHGPSHKSSAEAVTDCSVALIRRNQVERAAGDANVARTLWRVTAQDLMRLQEHMLLLGRKSAAERVAAFLVGMAGRSNDPDALELPMSRLDIADYLGLTIETVSRTMTQFERDGAIALHGSRRVILKRPGWLQSAAH